MPAALLHQSFIAGLRRLCCKVRVQQHTISVALHVILFVWNKSAVMGIATGGLHFLVV